MQCQKPHRREHDHHPNQSFQLQIQAYTIRNFAYQDHLAFQRGQASGRVCLQFIQFDCFHTHTHISNLKKIENWGRTIGTVTVICCNQNHSLIQEGLLELLLWLTTYCADYKIFDALSTLLCAFKISFVSNQGKENDSGTWKKKRISETTDFEKPSGGGWEAWRAQVQDLSIKNQLGLPNRREQSLRTIPIL